jgi:DHA1 family tetracycline resistance protein-like MFS transporter
MQVPRARFAPGTVAFIMITGFLNLAGIGLIAPVAPAMAGQYVPPENVDFTTAALVAAYSFFQFLSVPTLGALSDRFGRRPIMLFSLLGSAVGYFIFGIGGALWILYLGRIIDGVTGGNLATIYAYAADITEPQKRTQFFGKLGAISGMGFIVGPAIGGFIYRLTGSNAAPLYFAGFITIINAIWGYFVMPESLTPERRADEISLARLNPLTQLINVFKLPQLRLLLLGTFLWTFAFSMLQANVASFTQTQLNWKPDDTSLLFFMIGFIQIVMQGIVIPRLLPLFGEARISVAGLVILTVGFVVLSLLTFTRNPALAFVGIFFSAVGNGLVIPSVTGLLSQSAGAREQGRVQGGSQSVQALARVVGPAWVTVIFAVHHELLSAPYISGVIALIISIVAVIAAIPVLKAHQEGAIA